MNYRLKYPFHVRPNRLAAKTSCSRTGSAPYIHTDIQKRKPASFLIISGSNINKFNFGHSLVD